VPHDRRDEVVDFVRHWSEKAEIEALKLVGWIGIARSKYYQWQKRYGKVNEHNGWVSRDFWLEEWEKKAICDYHRQHPEEGYRRLTFMMLDQDVVAASPSSVYRVLKGEGLLERWNRKASAKGSGFVQPLGPHQHWHVDVSYVNLCGTFYYLCSVLDGCSRYLVHWDLRASMTEREVEIILQRAKEKYPQARPRVISDNGPQFVARDFKEFIRLSGMTHVRTAPYYPQSNGKLERYHGTLKSECLRRGVPLSLEEARRLVEQFVEHYNHHRLHSALGYVTPSAKLEGKDRAIFAERDRKLELARQGRQQKRAAAAEGFRLLDEPRRPLPVQR
jgi:putative transposase